MNNKRNNKRGCLGRRDFNKLVALGVACGAALPPGALFGAGAKEVVGLSGVIGGADLKQGVRDAVLAVDNLDWLSKGDSVLIKPVLNSGNKFPATTSPLAVAAMVELLKDRGAGRVVITDMSGIEHVKLSEDKLRGSSRSLMENSGIASAAREAGAELYFPEEDGWSAFHEEEPAQGQSWKNPVTMPNIVNDVDHIVLMPRCSRHLLAGSSLGMKAAVGWWRTDTRLEYHRDASTFQEKTAEANTVPSLVEKQRLVVTAADKIMATFGPDQGYVVEPDTGLVIASRSLLAHDMTSLAWLIENRKVAPNNEKSPIKDPYTSQMSVTSFNRGVVMMLGGPKHAARAEKLVRNDIISVMDDRVIRRAIEIARGKPDIEFRNANDTVPSDLVDRLKKGIS